VLDKAKRGLLDLGLGFVMVMPASTCDGGAEIAPKENTKLRKMAALA